MEKELVDFITEKTHELMSATSCCQELKEMAQKWLDAVGTDREAEVTKEYFKELEEDVTPIDGLISFIGSEMGAQIFGEERAKAMLEHAKEIKANGAEYCDCPACTAAVAILEKKEDIK